MRKMISLSLLALLSGLPAVRAQLIPSSNTSEIFYPALTLPGIFSNQINHVANYDLVDPDNQTERYSVWASNFAYQNTGMPTNTLAWRHEDTNTGALIEEGHIDDIEVAVPGEFAVELEPAVVKENNETYVIVAYYSCSNSGWAGSGHYYNIYKWEPTGLVLQSINQLSTLPRYTRISIDAFKSYALAITWGELDGIKIKTWHRDYASPWSQTFTIAGTYGCEVPDVSLSGIPGALLVRVAYLQATTLTVCHQAISVVQTAGGPTIPFNPDNSWATSYYYIPGTTYMQYGNYKCDFARTYFHLASPLQANSNGTWTCVYNDQSGNINARISYNGLPNTVNITGLFTIPAPYNTYRKEFPTLSYKSDQFTPDAIYFGFNVRNNGPNDQYFAVKTNIVGSPVVGGFMQVSNPAVSTAIGYFSGIAFPKFTLLNPELFVTFTGQQTAFPGGTHLITKKIPWPDNHFKPTGIEEHADSRNVLSAYPNPFREHFTFGGNMDLNKKYSINITDITGRNVLHVMRTLQSMNQDASAYRSLHPGIFLVEIRSENDAAVHQTIKLVKR